MKVLKGIKPNSQPVRNKKNRENTRQRKKITRTRQYLCGSAICLRPRSCRDFTIIKKKYRVQVAAKPPLHRLSLGKSPIKNHVTLFESGRVVKPDQIKLDSTKPNKSNFFNF